MVIAKHDGIETEIRNLDDLFNVVKAVRNQGEPLVLRVDEEEIVVKPAPRRRKRLTKEEREKADEEAFLSAAGSWKGHLDAEEFKRQIKAARGSHRPFVVVSLPEE